MGFLIPLLLSACSIENNIERCPDTGCPQNDAEDVPADVTSTDFPDLSGCDFAALALPVAEDESDSFDDACPLYYQGEQIGSYDAACIDSLDGRAKTIIAAIPDYFANDVPVMDILACKVPMTVFYEYRPIPAGDAETTADDGAKTETANVYISLNDQSESISAFESGALANPLPFPNLFVLSFLDYADEQTIVTSSVTHGIADADASPLPSETNAMGFEDDAGVRSLSINELDYATPCDGCDYTLATSGSTLDGFGGDLTDMVKALLEVEDGETETKRGGAFFPPED